MRELEPERDRFTRFHDVDEEEETEVVPQFRFERLVVPERPEVAQDAVVKTVEPHARSGPTISVAPSGA